MLGQYLHTPTNERIDNMFLRDVLSFIGKKYGSEKDKGSSFAKGIRYLRSQIRDCKAEHIKGMLNSVPNRMRGKNGYGFVFHLSINSYVNIFAKIVELIVSNHAAFSEALKKEISSIKATVPEPKYTYSELLIRETLISLEMFIRVVESDEYKSIAQKILDGIKSADKKYNIQ